MNADYCNRRCPIGKAARETFLELNESIFGAVRDFDVFTENCFKTCPYKAKHKIENEVKTPQ